MACNSLRPIMHSMKPGRVIGSRRPDTGECLETRFRASGHAAFASPFAFVLASSFSLLDQFPETVDTLPTPFLAHYSSWLGLFSWLL